jgi:hypothetical protein
VKAWLQREQKNGMRRHSLFKFLYTMRRAKQFRYAMRPEGTAAQIAKGGMGRHSLFKAFYTDAARQIRPPPRPPGKFLRTPLGPPGSSCEHVPATSIAAKRAAELRGCAAFFV